MKEYILRDPVHGDISVQDPVILGLIDAPEFQRLRRIRQLGTSYISYPGADHTRFAHSVGVYHLLMRVLRHFSDRGIATLDPEQRLIGACAALLHDVGHGPFSHLFEKITGTYHETWAEAIIRSPETEVHRRLAREGADWPERVVGLLTGHWDGAVFLPGLLASQLDVDRMDYLLRDALMCGVPYGRFDLDRLVGCLRVYEAGRRKPAVVVHRKGQSAAEAFILARYFMYWNVYFHKATRAAEVVLEKILQRAVWLYRERGAGALGMVPDPLVPILAGQPLPLDLYLRLDEVDCLYAIKQWAGAADPVLADLCRRWMDRRLPTGIPIGGVPDDDLLAAIRSVVAAAGFRDASYYVHVDRAANVAYSYYLRPRGGGPQPILLLLDEERPGQTVEISRQSEVLRSITAEPVTRYLLFVPKEAGVAVAALLGRQLSFEV